MKVIYQTDLEKAAFFLQKLISKKFKDADTWILNYKLKFKSSTAHKDLYMAFGLAGRAAGKELLMPDEQEMRMAGELRKGFSINGWTTDRALRVLLLLIFPHTDFEYYKNSINTLFSSADLNELVALYSALPLLPNPEEFTDRAAEGVRSNIGDVFDAVVFNNPYPADYLDEGAWNQMVLKTLFVGKRLDKIIGLDKRANPRLSRMLSDLAHERWAASREVSPELWRAVGPYIDKEIIKDLERVFKDSDPVQQKAAALACSACSLPKAKELLNERKDLLRAIENNELNWENLMKPGSVLS
ncbi:MAG TPA: EboA domain-containing protein [Cytophagaceae bacterium]